MSDLDLNSLPNEVLVRIFEDPSIPLNALLNIALTCKRLHYMCLPLYFARFGVHDPSERCEIIFKPRVDARKSKDVLSGLQIALSVRSIKSLVCRFDDGLDDYRLVMKNLNRLYNFLSYLTSVGEVTLNFGTPKRCGCCSDFDSGEVLDEELKEWSQTMGRFLNLVLSKSCTSLSITGGRYMGHSYSFKSGNRLSESAREADADKNHRTLSTIKNLFGKGKPGGTSTQDARTPLDVLKGNNWQFARTTGTGKAIVLTSLSALNRPNLRSLDIQSMMFTVPPLLHWFISALQLETVQSLSLRNLSVHRKCWPAILSLIATSAPQLHDLYLSGLRQIDPADLLESISNFPSLTALHIGHDVDSFDSFDLLPFPDFPYLVSLHAPAAWVFKLFSSQKKGLQCLESLSIAYNMRNDGLSHWVNHPSGPSIPKLLREQQRPLAISLIIYLGSSPGWKMLGHFNTHEAARSQEIESIGSLTLKLDEQIRRSDIPLTQVLSKWTSLFSGVHHLSLDFHPKALGAADSEKLAQQIIRDGKLPLLSSLEVGGREMYGLPGVEDSS